jgi:RNA polymerase sigma factor (sigma-70 family)
MVMEWTDTPADEVEWRKAVAGDGDAFGRLFDRHRRRVQLHCLRLAPTYADAEDVVAIAFLEAWRHRDRVRFVDGSMLPWLLVTATNSSRNVTRAARRYRDALTRLPPPEPVPDHAAEIGGTDVEQALSKLSLNDQRIVSLCVLEGYSEREAAQVLGVPPGTVKSRLSRAKARLRNLLALNPVETTTRAKEVSYES